jgi:hypothetical protein
MKTISRKTGLFAVAAAVTMLGLTGTASAAWYQYGVLVSNVCRAPSGAVWFYPIQSAQPVGSSCSIYSTGEYGIVTAF